MTPNQVDETNILNVFKAIYNPDKPVKPRKKNLLKVGDYVRMNRSKALFEKEVDPNWTTEVFVVTKVYKSDPVTYEVEDLVGEVISGRFYREELQSVARPETYKIENILKKKKDYNRRTFSYYNRRTFF